MATRIGNYEVERPLDAEGRSYLGQDTRDGRPVVLKTLSRGVLSTREAIAGIQKLAGAVARTGSARFARILGFAKGDLGGRITRFMVRPYLEGESLAARGGSLSSEECVTIYLALCDQLASIHEAGGHHGNLHARNVIVDGDSVGLTDWGLPPSPEARARNTTSGEAEPSSGPSSGPSSFPSSGPTEDILQLGAVLMDRIESLGPSLAREARQPLSSMLSSYPAERLAGFQQFRELLRASETSPPAEPKATTPEPQPPEAQGTHHRRAGSAEPKATTPEYPPLGESEGRDDPAHVPGASHPEVAEDRPPAGVNWDRIASLVAASEALPATGEASGVGPPEGADDGDMAALSELTAPLHPADGTARRAAPIQLGLEVEAPGPLERRPKARPAEGEAAFKRLASVVYSLVTLFQMGLVAAVVLVALSWAWGRWGGGGEEGPARVEGTSPASGTEEARAPSRGPMVLIPAGPFIYAPRDGPPRRVELPAFRMDRYEVSQAEYLRFVQRTGYDAGGNWQQYFSPGTDRYPVRGLTLDDAKAFARWAGKRLPTEQEWQKAAAGPKGRPYPWGERFEPRRCAWRRTGRTVPVDAFPEGASPFGVLNMVGNVWEWVSTEEKGVVVLMGGGFTSGETRLGCQSREVLPAGSLRPDPAFGFRCAKDA